ncbi:ATP-binding protein [Ponticaulis sp.]|uniref:sensor histidine kinase n=1 Tax=Ponticaulis sp. TaxID=2020902 RepID=UPI000B6AA320|nr:HAMP domain-containing sensor histidine kinase [Ponticaulis sp.]MAI90455.1 hypothetical protein [Ponticaulis sp.]OUY00154.1 MAG: hypothetical protein CBB65_08450 [Hyphomonadaceae bacterium TMED5]|tara:strand:- start:70762 stop:71958 length:1197 start_codon:yes stop_codon:yes gene_type:complete
MIHNLKNAILRPDEPQYIENAHENAVTARNLALQVEDIAEELGMEERLPLTRQMISAYQSRTETIRNMIAEGSSAREIDNVVRYDDTPALAELTRFETSLTRTLLAKSAYVRRLGLLVLFSLIVIAFIPIYLIHQERAARRIRKYNGQLLALNQALGQQATKLEQSNLALKQFAGIVSHDLNSPARQVKMFADIGLNAETNPDKQHLALERIRAVAIDMQELVARLLEFTKSAFQKPSPEITDPVEIAQKSAENVRQISPNSPEFIIEDMPDMNIDPVLMARVFSNLYSNAAKYVAPGVTPVVRTSCSIDRNEVLISVSDNGTGIPDNCRQIVFDPLRQLDSKNEGHGIGLSIVRTIIEAHGGTIELDPAHKSGSHFLIRLPISVLPPPPAAGARAAS